MEGFANRVANLATGNMLSSLDMVEGLVTIGLDLPNYKTGDYVQGAGFIGYKVLAFAVLRKVSTTIAPKIPLRLPSRPIQVTKGSNINMAKIMAGNINISNSIVKDLLSGKEIMVNTIREADALLKKALPNAVKVKGSAPNTVPDFSKFKGKNADGLYHKDYLINPETGRIYGHSPTNKHGSMKHINIKLPDGKKTAIMIKPVK